MRALSFTGYTSPNNTSHKKMFAQGPLLTVQQGHEGTFVRWLEELGLKDFLKRYPIPKLVEWGWLVPQYRYCFMREDFECDESATNSSSPESRDSALERLWRWEWSINSVDEPLWYLHPLFRPNDASAQMLLGGGKSWSEMPIPASFTTKEGRTYTPYVDYFYHWQGYALIDVIRFSDVIGNQPILNTPDAAIEAKAMARVVDHVKDWAPRGVLSAPARWGGLQKLMTWLSHYRAYRDAHNYWQRQHPEDKTSYRKGSLELAARLGVTEDFLAHSIKTNLLALAEDWQRTTGRKADWIKPAWSKLQGDVYLAIEWLCLLSGNLLEFYLDLWSYPPSRQSDGTAELVEVLPYEFYTDRISFFRNAPHYLSAYNATLLEEHQLGGEKLKGVVDSLRAKNYPFGSFLRSFSEMHSCLTYKFEDFGKIDFKERKPLDYFALVAIRAEACLMSPLLESKELDDPTKPLKRLEDYILHHAQQRQLSASAIDTFQANIKITKLHKRPDDAITRIIALSPPQLTPYERYMAQAFLCCVLARNYFAHHFYNDKKLLRDDESAFLLGGVLVTVLYLLGDS
jgi:hypothetical protein